MSTLKLPTIMGLHPVNYYHASDMYRPNGCQSNVALCRTTLVTDVTRTKTDSRVLSTRHPDVIKRTRRSAALCSGTLRPRTKTPRSIIFD